jgi:hypothetical protein
MELSAAMLLFMACLYGAREFHVDDPVLMTALRLSPVIPILLAALAVGRFYRKMDEYHRRQLRHLVTVAVAAITLCACGPFTGPGPATTPHARAAPPSTATTTTATTTTVPSSTFPAQGPPGP